MRARGVRTGGALVGWLVRLFAPTLDPGEGPHQVPISEGAWVTRLAEPFGPCKLAGEAPRDRSPAPDSGGTSKKLPSRLASRTEESGAASAGTYSNPRARSRASTSPRTSNELAWRAHDKRSTE